MRSLRSFKGFLGDFMTSQRQISGAFLGGSKGFQEVPRYLRGLKENPGDLRKYSEGFSGEISVAFQRRPKGFQGHTI